MKHSRRYDEVKAKQEPGVELELLEAVEAVKKFATAKFDETVEISINLGVDPRHADQMIRSTVSLPHGIGKTVRVLVLCKEDRVQDALDAGADYAGLDEYVEKIQGGWFEFDSAIATPDVMPMVGRIGKVLGPRGLMPNPKTGTVTADIVKAIEEVKAGRLSFRVDRYGILHIPVGKASFEAKKLEENISALLLTVQRLRPSTAKGLYFKGISLASTMGPGVPVNRTSALSSLR
ncbi:MAG: 50S ribosomal protein L1 [Calditrichaeota bacterium]|jgi:large subunit ribosomal protein L1|nr:50S ribosomal protein L1 [Calditrichota bacterium]MBT7616001.1 50S ribosomal protein L1 [Calditrichota bacterium]MBT7787369.1 50S ribosomal protein L1 [Calditrichota bacterium]